MTDHVNSIESLFDESNPLCSFSLESIRKIPEYGSILYAIFHKTDGFIYVGIGGNGKKRNPRDRMNAHRSGKRSGDQFCIYIQDFYVIPKLIRSDYTPQRGLLDNLVQKVIEEQCSFRYAIFPSEDGPKIVARLEKEIQMGKHLGQMPRINPLSQR